MEHGPNFKVRVKTKTWPCCVLGKRKSFGIRYLPLSITHSLNTVISSFTFVSCKISRIANTARTTRSRQRFLLIVGAHGEA